MKEKFSGKQAISAPASLASRSSLAGGGEIVRDDVARGHLYGGIP